MYALVEIKGKQYKAEEDGRIKVDHIPSDEGSTVQFSEVVLLRDGENIVVGQPFVEGAVVTAEIESHGRDPKVRVFKHKRRKNYRRTRGHRQHYSMLRVKEIAGA